MKRQVIGLGEIPVADTPGDLACAAIGGAERVYSLQETALRPIIVP